MTEIIPPTVMDWMCKMAPLVLQEGNMDSWYYLKQQCAACMSSSWTFESLCAQSTDPETQAVMQSALDTATQKRLALLQSVLSEAQGKVQVHDAMQGIKKAKLAAEVSAAQAALDALVPCS